MAGWDGDKQAALTAQIPKVAPSTTSDGVVFQADTQYIGDYQQCGGTTGDPPTPDFTQRSTLDSGTSWLVQAPLSGFSSTTVHPRTATGSRACSRCEQQGRAKG